MKKKIIEIFVCMLLILTIIPISVSSNETFGKTIHVDDDNTSGPWFGTPEHPYQYIQDAVDAASDGDTIFVNSGSYKEIIGIDKSITLAGEDKNTTVVDGCKSLSAVNISADGVSISGFTFQNDGGLGLDIYSDYNHIFGNIFTNNLIGVFIALSNQNTISNNRFIANRWHGLIVDGSFNIISDNVIVQHEKFGMGISLSHNIVNRNHISRNKGGIDLFPPASDTTISMNNITNNNGYGLSVGSVAKNSIVKNNLIGNDVNADFQKSLLFVPLIMILLKIDPRININSDYTAGRTIWDGNYWDDLEEPPYPIYGSITLWGYHMITPIKWVNYDRHPAAEPYDI